MLRRLPAPAPRQSRGGCVAFAPREAVHDGGLAGNARLSVSERSDVAGSKAVAEIDALLPNYADYFIAKPLDADPSEPMRTRHAMKVRS